MIHDYVGRISHDDWQWMAYTLGSASRIFKPDLAIAPRGKPYLFRWYLTPYRQAPSVYLHLQVASDPERPLHDHPWANVSHIRSGTYTEMLQVLPPYGEIERCVRQPGDIVHREASWAHRLILPADMPYVLTIFTSGRYEKSWGFWHGTEFVDHTEVVHTENGLSINTGAL